MELKQLYIERKKRIQKFKDEKTLLREEFKSELEAIDKQITGKKKAFSNSKANTVKQVLKEIKNGGHTKSEYKWNKVQKLSDKKDKK